ncbi:MAG: glycosyltransferase [Thermoleophilaceae bacterium]
MDVSVIVPLQGGADRALRCFEALAALPPEPSHEVIVVDDASPDLAPLLERLGGDVTVVRSERRLGFAGAAALGAERAKGQILALLRDGPEIGHGWLAPLAAALADPGVSAATSAAPHPVTARSLALRSSGVAALSRAAGAGETHEMGALLLELAGAGRVVTAPESTLRGPAHRAPAARLEPGTEPELTIVVPTLDATSERLRRCVAAVQAATGDAYEIVIVDNGAPPQGFTPPVNAGIRAARGEYVVIMNDDVEPLAGWWPPLRAALDGGEACVFPLTVGGNERRDFAPWCLALSRAAVERFGAAPGEFYDPAMRVWFQDTDLHLRLMEAGVHPRLVESSEIRHGLSETLTSDDPALQAWIEQQVARDREAFDAKHPGAPLRVIEFEVTRA